MKMGSLVMPETDWRDGLPPDDYWATDPNKTFATPVDSRGLIIVDELIDHVKAYICPEYEWPEQSDEHHLYFEEEEYRWLEEWSMGRIPSLQFRELPVNKILTPRYFHNVLHKVARKAEMPSPEVMRNYIDAWRAARNLFLSIRNAAQAERRRKRRGERAEELTPEEMAIGAEIMQSKFERHFRGISRHLGTLATIPQEYWPFNPEQSALLAAGQIGQLVLHHHQRQKRSVLLPEEPRKPCGCLRCGVNRSIITPVNN